MASQKALNVRGDIQCYFLENRIELKVKKFEWYTFKRFFTCMCI